MAMEGHVIHGSTGHSRIEIVKSLDPEDAFYGLGDKTGYLNKRGYDYMMWNSDNPDPQLEVPTFKAMYKSIPFFLTLKKHGTYGIFFDNENRSYFDMGYESDSYYFFGADEGFYDYYFFAGNTPADVIREYTSLTGRTPLPQLWTLGYHQSRWSYMSKKEVSALASRFRELDIPCDVIHLDIDYMDHFKVFTWDQERFKDPEGFCREMKNSGFKLVTIIDPGVKVEKGYSVYEEGMENSYFAKTPKGDVYENVVWPGDSVYPDFSNQEVREWWGIQCKKLIDIGIRGIWNDMNEPASFHGPLPDDVMFSRDGEQLPHSQIHNVYGHLMSKATYEALKKYDGKRPFVITRACYSGSGKYATAWTGDNHSIWAHLQMAIPQLCNLGISGMCFIGTDVGGFGSNVTAELMSRWIQIGCFSPLFRNHSAKYTRRQEPWEFDEETLQIYRKYVKLRYKLLPYFYDLFWEQTKTGLPIIRPLFLEYPEDFNTREMNDEFMVGKNILVAPVVEQGKRQKMLYLPSGKWVDYWNHAVYEGGQYIIRDAPLDTCPIFIKQGAILPTYNPMQYVGETDFSSVTFEIYEENLPAEIPVVLDTYTSISPTSSKTTETGALNVEATSPVKENAAVYNHYLDNGEDFSYLEGYYHQYQCALKDGTLHITLQHAGYEKPYSKIITKNMLRKDTK